MSLELIISELGCVLLSLLGGALAIFSVLTLLNEVSILLT